VRFLLDTHVWLWTLLSPERIPADTRELLAGSENDLILSAASSWEIAIKYRLGQKETLEALACFDTRPGSPTVRWLEINGNSGAGKSSLMNAGLLPLVDQGWLWPRTGDEHWRRIGPMMPGEHPVRMLAEQLAHAFGGHMTPIRQGVEGDALALTEERRTHKQPGTAFLLAIDQLEELFTFVDPEERKCFDRLLAAALEDDDCPLFVISTVRADFLDRFAEDLPRLADLSNWRGKAWRLPPIGADGLREIIKGPARLAGLDVGGVQEAIAARWEYRHRRRAASYIFPVLPGRGALRCRAGGRVDKARWHMVNHSHRALPRRIHRLNRPRKVIRAPHLPDPRAVHCPNPRHTIPA
jgi:hypothetical protein